MKFKAAVIQNFLLVIGVAAIYKYFSLRYIYSMFVTRERGMPLLDGEGIKTGLVSENYLGVRHSYGIIRIQGEPQWRLPLKCYYVFSNHL